MSINTEATVVQHPSPPSASNLSKTTDHRVTLTLTPHTTIHIRVQTHLNCIVVLLTSSSHETSGSSGVTSPLGSFVYALPNRLYPTQQPISTPLVTVASSVEFATRAARILARRLDKPVYVGNSISLAWGPVGAGGPEVEEEIEALRKVIETVTAAVGSSGANGAINGH